MSGETGYFIGFFEPMGDRKRRSGGAFVQKVEEYRAYAGAVPLAPRTLAQWLEATRIEPLGASRWRYPSDRPLGPDLPSNAVWPTDPVVESSIRWVCFAAGSGLVQLDGEPRARALQAGELMLLPANRAHAIRPRSRGPMAFYSIRFRAQLFGSLDLLEVLGFPLHFMGDGRQPYLVASETIAREFALKEPGWKLAMGAAILTVLFYLLRHHGRRFDPPASRRTDDLLRILPALHAIDERLGDPELTVAELAAKLFVGQVHFRKLFRRATGKSPVDFIRMRRIETACQLLRGSSVSIKEVAAAAGFGEVPYFYRVFRQQMRVTPAQYRQGAEV